MRHAVGRGASREGGREVARALTVAAGATLWLLGGAAGGAAQMTEPLTPGATEPVAESPVAETPVPAPLPVVAPHLARDVPGWMPAAPAGVLLQERRGRQTWRFARWGAVIGGAAGLTAGALYAVYCSAGAYGDCGDVLLGFTALGIASGFVGGAIIGAAVPAQRATPADTATPDRPPPDPAASAPGRPVIGTAALGAGLAHARVSDEMGGTVEGTGPAVRGSVHAVLRPWLGLGPELGVASLGDAGDVRHLALSLRMQGRGTIAPFGAMNLGAYDSTGPSLEYLGGGVGGGVRMETGTARRYSLEVEARHSRNAQNIAPMRMWTIAVSGGLSW